ncbi:hypothetical protein JTB14_030987 [Gonioctena quinquepunctata]|nr:hypothetical protein JTB14_030987 [Gonioctena quinquepunctata]
MCLNSNIAPCVMMEMGVLENFVRMKKLSEKKQIETLKPEKENARRRISSTASEASMTDNTKTELNSKNTIIPDPLRIASNTPVPMDSEESRSIVNVSESAAKESNENDSSSDSPAKESNEYDSPDDESCLVPVSVRPKKRRLTDSDFSSEPETKRTPPPERPPKEKQTFPLPLPLAKSVPRLICSICNTPLNSDRALKRHQLKHLRCQFCKSKFRTMASKEEHIAGYCEIKNMMKDLPSVDLVKVELDVKSRLRYPDAFMDYPGIPGQTSDSEKTEEYVEKVADIKAEDDGYSAVPGLASYSKTIENYNKKKTVDVVTGTEDDIIEILSDDDDETISPSRNEETSTKNDEIRVLNITMETSNSESTPTTPTVGETESSTIPPLIPLPVSVSIVRPDIRIKNNLILDMLDPKLTTDIKIAKELLTKFTVLNLRKESSCETDLPSSESINVDAIEKGAAFKHLKSLLYVYKIPVVMKKGLLFQVGYDYHRKRQQPRKLNLWNDLTPVDVKASNSPIEIIEDSSPSMIPLETTRSVAVNGSVPTFSPLLNAVPVQNNQNFIKLTPANSFQQPISNMRVFPRKKTAAPTTSVNSNFISNNINTSNQHVPCASPSVQVPNSIFLQPILPNPVGYPGSTISPNVIPPTRPSLVTENTSMVSENVNSVPNTLDSYSCFPFTNHTPVVSGNVNRVPNTLGSYSCPGSSVSPNVTPLWPSLVATNTPVVSGNVKKVPNTARSHSVIYNIQSSSVGRNIALKPVPTTNSAEPKKTGPAFGSIRVKSMWELK